MVKQPKQKDNSLPSLSTQRDKHEQKNRLTLQTNSASYSPGEKVTLIGEMSDPHFTGDVKVEYFHLQNKLKEKTISVEKGYFSEMFSLPQKDFQGYLLKVNVLSDPTLTSTIAIDVSSDWSKFPRYGFLSEFGDKPKEEIKAILTELNRFHINGLQFYDYHYKHHLPLKMNRYKPADHWKDIANRTTSLNTLNNYIQGAHSLNMKTMAYNLLNGTLEDADKEGVSSDWYLYQDKKRKSIDSHPLPDDWKSNVLLTNPTHPNWQQYIIKQQDNVYDHLNFDGWHIDQLGNRGEVFNEHGDAIALDKSFGPFLQTTKFHAQSKRLVMNAVNQFGQEEIAKSPVDFLYTEVWDQYKYFGDLKRIIDENGSLSDQTKNTVIAGYMNYNHSNSPGKFNEAGILLANSVIFAAGGSHLELGEHMLSKEYFPHNHLKMSDPLRSKLISYYDFLVAYQNVLRDNVTETDVVIQTSTPNVSLSSEAEQGKLWTFSKQKANQKILHFINFLDANSMEWRDTEGTQNKPTKKGIIKFVMKEEKQPKKVWLASPDLSGGLPIEIPFTYQNQDLSFQLPSIEYWDMIVVDYE
jgi:dextranase